MENYVTADWVLRIGMTTVRYLRDLGTFQFECCRVYRWDLRH